MNGARKFDSLQVGQLTALAQYAHTLTIKIVGSFNIKMLAYIISQHLYIETAHGLYKYMNCHYRYNTVPRPSYLYKRNSYTRKDGLDIETGYQGLLVNEDCNLYAREPTKYFQIFYLTFLKAILMTRSQISEISDQFDRRHYSKYMHIYPHWEFGLF